jgi:hypothetical protein
MKIVKFNYDSEGSGLAISQQKQIERLDKLLAELVSSKEAGAESICMEGNRNQTWCPVPTGWSAIESAVQQERADQHIYARNMGALMWMQQTAQHGPHTSVLSGHTSNPSRMDADFQEKLLRYYVGPARELQLHFYKGPPNFNRRQVTQQHAFVDVGCCGAVNGGLQKGRMHKMGPKDFPGVTVCSRCV